MALFLLFSLLSSALSLSEVEAELEFSSFKQKFSKSYSKSEHEYRYQVFKNNLSYIQKINSENLGFSLQIGPHADQSAEEFSFKPFLNSFQNLQPTKIHSTANLPISVDWVEAGKIGSLRTLNTCKASWAFAALDTIESIIAITLKKPILTLSVQQLVSCSQNYGNNGCAYGTLNNTFSYASQNSICTNALYPFVDKNTKCNKQLRCQYKIDGFEAVQPNDESQLKAVVASQPVAVTLNDGPVIQHYGGGIIPNNWCGNATSSSNYVVVGYGSIAGTNFWVVRSYFGPSWGIAGYGLVARNDSNINAPGACGIATAPLYPEFTP